MGLSHPKNSTRRPTPGPAPFALGPSTFSYLEKRSSSHRGGWHVVSGRVDSCTVRNLIIRLFVNAVALWVAARLLDGIELTEELGPVVLVAAVFGLVNALIKPLVFLLSLPVVLLTLGLFTIVINALMLMLTGRADGLAHRERILGRVARQPPHLAREHGPVGDPSGREGLASVR